MIQYLSCQYGEIITDKKVNGIEWTTILIYLKANLVMATREIDYVFKQIWGRVILCGLHHIGQI